MGDAGAQLGGHGDGREMMEASQFGTAQDESRAHRKYRSGRHPSKAAPHPKLRLAGPLRGFRVKVAIPGGGQRMRETPNLVGQGAISVILLVVAGVASPCRAGGNLSSSSPLDLGFHQMYDLQFEEAHRTFNAWEQMHPDDPLGATSDAAAYLFSELDRLGVLQLQLFLDDEKFKQGKRLAPDPVVKQEFDKALARSERVANSILAHSPRDRNALLAKVMDLGLRSDYLALIEKRYIASVGYMKSAGMLAEQLLTIDPFCYDAYLAIGVENYILGLKPAPVRWVLRIYGAQTDKDQGIQRLRLTAEKGHYLLPLAQLLLAVAALRDKDRNKAKELLTGLAQQFPNNGLYRRELNRLH